jgi:hypothetical protein
MQRTELTTIAVSKKTRSELQKYAHYKDSMDSVITRLLQKAEDNK